MTQYNDFQLIEHFMVDRVFLFHVFLKLKHLMEKKNIYHQCVIPIGIQVACSLYKIVHISKLFQCSELFTINKSTMHLVLRKFVFVLNIVFKNQIMLPKGKKLVKVVAKFKNCCGIPSFHKTIDITQIHVQKPQTIDYFFFKSKGYNM
jgi:hypothetical protein